MPIALVKVTSLSEIEWEFLGRASKTVWCNVATVDSQGRPRSRIMHPIWEGFTGWAMTRRGTPKSKHLDKNPYVSVAYIADVAKATYLDCKVEWVLDLAEKQRVWELTARTPAPLGYDPAPIYRSVDDPDFGLLKLVPWRIQLDTLPNERRVWQS
jgi:general stress protein 26